MVHDIKRVRRWESTCNAKLGEMVKHDTRLVSWLCRSLGKESEGKKHIAAPEECKLNEKILENEKILFSSYFFFETFTLQSELTQTL